MRIVVLGAGALGSVLGAKLSVDHDVVLVARRPHVEAIRAGGLRVTGLTEGVFRVEARTDTKGLDEPDLVVVTTKAYDTATALDGARNILGPDTRVLTLQNGLGPAELVADVVGARRAIAGTITIGCTLREPGWSHHAGHGEAVVGPIRSGVDPGHEELAAVLSEAGVPTQTVDDILPALWSKVAVNVAINPITAITGLPNGAIAEMRGLRELAEAAATEVEDVARAVGIEVEPGRYAQRAIEVAKSTAENKSSMLQDVERGNRTEIDSICGAVARAGEQNGIPAPRVTALHALVRGIEATLRYDQ